MYEPMVPFLKCLILSIIFINFSFEFQKNFRGICEIGTYRISNDKFQCKDGSKWISVKELNDNYCDCIDSSDEPGTSACQNGTFCCINVEHRPMILLSKYVDDGVCDCCDGSDEINLKCPNTCQALKLKENEVLERKLNVLKQAYTLREKAKDEISAKFSSLNSTLEEKVKIKQTLQVEISNTKVLVETAKNKMNSAVEHFMRAKEKIIAKSMVIDLIYKMQELNKLLVGLSEDEEKAVLFYKKYSKRSSFNYSMGLISHLKQISNLMLQSSMENSNNEEYSDSNLDGGVIDSQHFNENDVNDGSLHGEDDLKDVKEEEYEIDTEKIPDNENYDELTSSLINEYKQLEKQFKTLNEQLHHVESVVNESFYLNTIDFGEHKIYYLLYNECPSMEYNGYEYKLCFFKSITQSNQYSTVSLGKWTSWIANEVNEYDEMLYDIGDQCWNGQTRATKVILKCGLENKVISASEPSMCQYELIVTTPLRCPDIPQEINNNFIDYVMTHDEL